MEKNVNVVLLCRVSTNIQDYERQINELTEFCSKQNWQVCKIFANKISGAKKNIERKEITEMLDYLSENTIDKVVVLEISRLGRNTLEALKVIELLNEKGICLYIKNYGISTLDENGKPNPIASLLTTILLEIAAMERLTISERMRSGHKAYLQNCRANNLPIGRPSTYRKSDEAYREQYAKEISLLKKGISLRNIKAITGSSVNTLLLLKQKFIA